MAIVQKQIQYAQEVGDVVSLLVEILKDVKAGKDAASVVSENVPGLVAALAGVDQIKDELQANPSAVASTVGLHLGDIAGVFLAPSVQVVPAPQG